jgi:cytochrome P450
MVRDPNLVKEIFLKPFEYGKFDVKMDKSKELFGHFSLAAVNGDEWVLHRRILDPAFHMESIKVVFQPLHNIKDAYNHMPNILPLVITRLTQG